MKTIFYLHRSETDADDVCHSAWFASVLSVRSCWTLLFVFAFDGVISVAYFKCEGPDSIYFSVDRRWTLVWIQLRRPFHKFIAEHQVLGPVNWRLVSCPFVYYSLLALFIRSRFVCVVEIVEGFLCLWKDVF